MKKSEDNGKFISSAKIGPKGQIVIPKEIRDMFGLEPGDSVVIMADKERGIALQKASVMWELAAKIMGGKPGKDEKNFAETVRKELEGDGESDNNRESD